jgi:HEAT repeat protein
LAERRSLSEAAMDPDPAVRREAISALVARGDAAAVDELRAALLRSQWPVCDELSEGLAQIATEEAKSALMDGLRARRHHVRSAVIRSLAQFAGEDVKIAIAQLGDDRSYEVRQDVAEALKRLQKGK